MKTILKSKKAILFTLLLITITATGLWVNENILNQTSRKLSFNYIAANTETVSDTEDSQEPSASIVGVKVLFKDEEFDYLGKPLSLAQLADHFDIPQGSASNDLITEFSKVRLKEVIVKETKETETIAFGTTKTTDENLTQGNTRTVKQGVDGTKEVTYEVTYEDGEQVSKEKIAEEVIAEPINEIIAQGTKAPVTASSTLPTEPQGTITMNNGEEFQYCSIKYMKMTSYDSSCLGCNMTTSVGATLRRGVIAVNPAVIPYYTMMYIPHNNYGLGQALDTGGAMRQNPNTIDLGFATSSERIAAGFTGVLYGNVYLGCN